MYIVWAAQGRHGNLGQNYTGTGIILTLFGHKFTRSSISKFLNAILRVIRQMKVGTIMNIISGIYARTSYAILFNSTHVTESMAKRFRQFGLQPGFWIWTLWIPDFIPQESGFQ